MASADRQSEGASLKPGPSWTNPIVVPDHELVRAIGRGSYGEVWLARSVLGALRAVKVVFRRSFSDGHPYEREFSGILRIEPLSRAHEGLVDILHVGRHEPEGYFYYVMELADDAGADIPSPGGGAPDLSRYQPRTLTRELHSQGRIPFQQCVQLGLALSSALSHLHHNCLIHRDVKPSNILYIGGVPKLGDIGLVGETGDSASYVGTEGYIPPEGPGTPQADVFGLGKVLYEASTGLDRMEFPTLPTALGEGPARAQAAELNEIFLKACAPDPRARYHNAEEMHADLALLHRGQSLRRQRKNRRREKRFVLAGFVAAALVGGALGSWWSPRYRLPAANPGAQPHLPAMQQPVDLSHFYNVTLSSNWTRDFPGNNLSSLPSGWHQLGPAHFSLRGLIQISGGFLESHNLFYPSEARGIPVNRRCARLYFLHGTVWYAETGLLVASYVVHYADGRQEVIPLRYGEHFQNWWWHPQWPINARSADVAWIGTNVAIADTPDAKLCLYAIIWNNPFPELPIASLDFVSTRSAACPFLVAVSSD